MKWQDMIKTIAPSIASALGGPLAESAVKAISALFLGNSTGTNEELNAPIEGATPDQLIKLKELDLHFQQLQVDQYKNEALDRDSARDLAIRSQNKT